MTAVVRLGLRLAGGGGARERARTAAVACACAVGTWILLNAAAIANAEHARMAFSAEGQRLFAVVMLAVATPVIVLIATAVRLSSTLRDRRLAGLRLLGLSPSGTRVVAAVESGVGALIGALLGLGAFWLTRSSISGLEIAGRDWSQTPFTPGVTASTLVPLTVAVTAIAVSLVPTRRLHRDVLAKSRVAGSRRPSPLRLIPLSVGALLCLATVWNAPGDISGTRGYTFILGAALCGLGLLLVVPVFVRLLADLLVRVPGRPPIRIAGRRLQAQPAIVTRVVSGLLIGLFVVSGARWVVGAFEATPQYQAAERAVLDGPATYAVQPPARMDVAGAQRALQELPGVQGVVVVQRVQDSCGRRRICAGAFVGTCADLAVLDPAVRGCDDDEIAWLGLTRRRTEPFEWSATEGRPPRLTLPAPPRESVIALSEPDSLGDELGYAHVFIPVTTPGISRVLERAHPGLVVAGAGGGNIGPALQQVISSWGNAGGAYPLFAVEDYQFVAGLRAMVWALAAVVLSIGLLAFAISAIDRAVARRAEMVSLQLLGTPPSVIRAAQWWEALLPLALGLPGAVLLGSAVGRGYLLLAEGAPRTSPLQSTLLLAVVATGAAVLVAGLTVIASAPKVRADLIRRA